MVSLQCRVDRLEILEGRIGFGELPDNGGQAIPHDQSSTA